MTYRYVSCQTFAGGFDVGATQAGWKLVHKVEQRGGFGMRNCLVNRGVLGPDWTYQSCSPDEWQPVVADAVFANPPCSGFSLMTDRRWRGADAKVNACMHATMAYAARIRPQVVVMESVRQAYTGGRELMTQLRAELEQQSGCRYDLYHVFQNAHALGGPAIRPRYFWVASRVPFGVSWPNYRRPELVDVIGDLDGLASSWRPQPYRRPASWWVDDWNTRRADGVVDGHVGTTSPYHRRALDLLELASSPTPDGAPGAGWCQGEHIGQVAQRTWETRVELPRSWDAGLEKLIKMDFHMGYTSMTRWRWNAPGRVITGGSLGLVLHPLEPRTITHREAARIMGFPDDWLIEPLRGTSGLAQTWGKGITAHCGRWVAGLVARALDGDPGEISGVEVGDRERWIKDPR